MATPVTSALVLAAGEGTRMRPLTAKRPKPLLPVAGKPLLMHTLDALAEGGIRDVTILVGRLEAKLREAVRVARVDLNISFAVQEEILGTAHAVASAAAAMKPPFLCLNGDVLVAPGLVKSLAESYDGGEVLALSGKPLSDPAACGRVRCDSAGRAVAIIEKSSGGADLPVNAGIYVFSKELLDAARAVPLSPRGEYELTDALQSLIDAGRPVRGHPFDGPWLDIGKPWDLLTANEVLMARLNPENRGQVEEGVHIEGPVAAGKGTVIRRGSYIVGPAVFGEGCDIGPNAFIRPSTSVGDRCRIGAFVEVKNTIVMDDTHIPHLSYIGDSIIGERCNLGAGTITANLRLDEKAVLSFAGGRRVSTGRRKLGAIMGDDVKTGINSMFDVGAVVGEDCRVGPGAFVKGWVAPGTTVL